MTSSPPPLHNQINTTAVADGSSNTGSSTTPWSSETNWTVSRGSLDSAVTFESFDFPIDSEFTARKPPLILVPPSSSDFEPCEIKLNFTQKHEIRQVYIKSTARNYEIYYAPNLQSENEYLCTVRCSAASIEDNLFPATDVTEAIPVNLEDPIEKLPKGKVAGENNIGTSEDDWVEIKHPVNQLHEGINTSNNTKNYQNYYEATAEINDSDPCMSLTLRLLSLQSKGCVYVDEVYVFADAIETNDSENQTINKETSAGNSLMTMLVPTLLGLSKSRSLQLPEQHSPKPVIKPIEIECESATSANPVNLAINQQDKPIIKPIEIEREYATSANSVNLAVNQQDEKLLKNAVSDTKMRNGYSDNRLESLLEQLVSRVSRIEDICMKFEENMLKPINNMEARLERVEQQVELLVKKSEFPILPLCQRSVSDEGNNSGICDESESEKKEEPVSSESPEKEEVNDLLESPKDEKPKKTVSIDDALAAALAGFSSFKKPDDSFPVIPLESPEEECLKRNEVPTTSSHDSTSNGEVSDSCESPKAIEENNEGTKCNESPPKVTCRDTSIEIPDNIFILEGTSELADLEATTPTSSFNHETDAQITKQESVKAVKISSLDKAEILKYFPDQIVKEGCCESSVDFESPILEVKFTSLEIGSRLKSDLETLLSNSDDSATTDNSISGVSKECDVEENMTNANGLLVELDGNHEELENIPPVEHEPSFASLI